jgi:phosphoglycerol transferase MdoB-like AlkP superfamily enzyme
MSAASRWGGALATARARLADRWPVVAAALALALKQVALVLAFDLETGPLLAVTTVATGLALVAPAGALAGRRQVIGALLLDALGSAVLLADLLHHRHYGDVFSAASLRFARQLGAETGAVAQLLRPRDLLLFADLPLLLAGLRWAGRAAPLPPRRAAALVLGAIATVTAIRLTDPTRTFQQKGHAWPVRRLGPFAFHALDFGRAAAQAFQARAATPELVAAVGADLAARRAPAPGGHPLRGAARGMNLVVVQVESLQGFALGARVGGESATPHLDALARESIVFDRFHHQVGLGVTSDADYAFNCSGHALPEGSVYVEHADGEFRCLPNLLAERGYATAAFQAIWPWFWNLATAYPRIGYQRFDALDDYVVGDRFHRHGLVDRPFVEQTLPRLAALREPFLAYVVTLTSHVPFDFGEPLPEDPAVDKAVARYLSAIRYADRAVGDLVDGLRKAGLLDRTVLVVYGDHHALRRSDGLGAYLGIAKGADAAWFAVEKRVPLLVRLPGGAAAGRRDALGGQIDLAPTLAALLGVDASSAPFFGRDLLAGPAPFVAFPDGSATDGRRIHDAPAMAASARCLDAIDGRTLPAAECAPLASAAAEELAHSRALVEGRLLPRLGLGANPSSPPPPSRGGTGER